MNNKFNWLLMFGIILTASTLRAPLTAVGPIINILKHDLSINNTLAGLITTIPLLVFGIVSPMVVKVTNRLTIQRTIFYAVILLMLGLLIRISGGMAWFFVGTVIIGIAIAFGNVMLPAYVKSSFPLYIGLATGIYSATMNLTAGLGGGLSYPLSHYSYRLSLSIWLVFAVVALIIWLPQLKRTVPSTMQPAKMTLLKSPLAWAVAVTMGMQSMMFYTTVTWIPSIIVDRGVHPETAGYYLMLNQFAQVPMTFLVPVIAAKMKHQKVLIIIIGLVYFLGFSLLFTADWLAVAMILIGLAGGASFSICMTFFSIRARTQEGSIALSGFGQSIGYFIAAIGPFLIGYIHDQTGEWTTSIIMLLIMAAGFLVSGLLAAREQVVEDQC